MAVMAAFTLPQLRGLRQMIFLSKQLELVKLQAIKGKRQDRMDEILTQLTPALPYFASLTGMQPNKHKWTYELLNLVLAFSSISLCDLNKPFNAHGLWSIRPT